MSLESVKSISEIKVENSKNMENIDPNNPIGIDVKLGNLEKQKEFNPNKLIEVDSKPSIDISGSDKELEKSETENARYIECRNQSLKGEQHPITGVPFVEKTITKIDGEKVRGVFSQFESKFDAQLPVDLYTETDRKQFAECNKQLKEQLKENPSLREQFDKEQLEQIENGETPDGYVWHHNEEEGKMQLVDFETHQSTGHTGGKAVWGEGNR